jgi:Tfp pilus assembly protein PilP
VEKSSRDSVVRRFGCPARRGGVIAALWLLVTGGVPMPSRNSAVVGCLFVPGPAYAQMSHALLVAQQKDGAANSYRYETQGRRDPLEILVKEKPPVVEAGPVIDPQRPRGPLERFDLSALKLMGIVWGERGRRAVIRAPDGKGYFITVGMYMGQNGGKVIAIEEDRLIVEERHRDQQGDIIGKTLTIQLRRKENQQG